MYLQTDLMTMIFSNTDASFNDSVQNKVEEAMENGVADLTFSDMSLNFAATDEGVVIEDTTNGEVTLATFSDDGEVELHAFSATQPDVKVPRATGTDGEHITNTTPKDDSDPSKDPKGAIRKEAGIVDDDKAGLGKHFSEEDLAFSAQELHEDYERLMGTQDMQLAYSVLDNAESIKAYSVIAQEDGVDTSDLIERCNEYSDYANEVIMDNIANMNVNDYFSELDEDEINEYFSNLDEVESEVLYSALEDGDCTFSDVEDMVDECYSEIELNQPMSEVFSEMSEEEADEFFSDFSEDELDLMFSLMDYDEDATFSDYNELADQMYSEMEELSQPVSEIFSEMDDDEIDAFFSDLTDTEAEVVMDAIDNDATFSEVNEVLDNLYTPLDEMFSDYTEDDFTEMFSEMSEDEVDLFSDMITDDEYQYCYSDYLEAVEEMNTFSKEDEEKLANNANELTAAADDLAKTKDPELAKKVKLLADKTVEDAETAEKGGCDAKDVKEMCSKYSELAADILDQNGIDPGDVQFSDVFEYDEDTDTFSEIETPEDTTYSDTYLTAGEATFSAPAISTPSEDQVKLFANLDEFDSSFDNASDSGINNCLHSSIN